MSVSISFLKVSPSLEPESEQLFRMNNVAKPTAGSIVLMFIMVFLGVQFYKILLRRKGLFFRARIHCTSPLRASILLFQSIYFQPSTHKSVKDFHKYFPFRFSNRDPQVFYR